MCGLDVVVDLRKRKLTDVPECLSLENCSTVFEPAGIRRTGFTAKRGPDFVNSVIINSDEYDLDMFSSVLQIQGSEICLQPLRFDTCDSYLLWNGEYLNHSISVDSDTRLIMMELDSCKDAVTVLNNVEGPFSFVYYDSLSHNLWFGKDKQGRRSLLISCSDDKLCVSSTGLLGGVEIPAGRGIFQLHLKGDPHISFHAYSTPIAYLSPHFFAGSNECLPNSLHASLVRGTHRHLQISNVASTPLGILFSGGLDSVILAALAANFFVQQKAPFTHIDLINVGGVENCPDRLTGLASFSELLTKFPTVPFRFIAVDICDAELAEHAARIMALIAPHSTHMDFNIGSALWFGARGLGRVLDPQFVHAPEWRALLAKIVASESLEAARENRTSKIFDANFRNVMCSKCECRKRKLGCAHCRFCCKQIDCVVHAAKTAVTPVEHDMSFLEKFFFSKKFVQSDCRILLLGHGADELFGGYGRHETRMRRGGLREELLIDLARLWTRNLARDDRIVADHARDARHPYLDEDLVALVGSQRLDEQLVSNKGQLRAMARECLHLELAPQFRKRAIQFGTRLAQKANIAAFGSHKSGSGIRQYTI